MTRHSDSTPLVPASTWHLQEIQTPEGPRQPRVPVSLEVAEEGTYTASAGCNTLRGRFVDQDGAWAPSLVASTRMGCPDAEAEMERLLTATLPKVQVPDLGARESAESEGRTLTLRSPDVTLTWRDNM